MMRGVKKEQARLVTSVFHGKFNSDEALRREFIGCLKIDDIPS
jgi:GTP cyclohydrolase I